MLEPAQRAKSVEVCLFRALLQRSGRARTSSEDRDFRGSLSCSVRAKTLTVEFECMAGHRHCRFVIGVSDGGLGPPQLEVESRGLRTDSVRSSRQSCPIADGQSPRRRAIDGPTYRQALVQWEVGLLA